MMQDLLIPESSIADRQKLFTALYEEAFPVLAKYISKMGGSFEEAKDVFQDALVIFYEKTQAGGFVIEVNDKSYLLGIAKHLYLKRYRLEKQTESIDAATTALVDIEQPKPAAERLLRFLEAAGKKCMDMLQAYYYDKRPLTEIADSFGYSGVRSATVQKYKCLEKVRENIKQKALTYDNFLD
jgi:RNA polymerase sigma factor (sigma-70 family)